jgi:hypothetical protein
LKTIALFLLMLLAVISMAVPYARASTDEEVIESEPEEPETEEVEVEEEEPEEETDPEIEEEDPIVEEEEPETEPEEQPEVEEEETKEKDGGIFGPGGECENPDDEDNCIEGTPCHKSYPDFCIPAPPPDKNCDDIKKKNFTVKGSDPHGFDGDNDGKGCEVKDGNGGGGHGKGGDNDIHININVKEKDNDNNNKKKDSKPQVDKYQVVVILNGTEKAEDDKFRMRVIAYGPNTLNKPTLDKPGQLVDLKDCEKICYTTWGFTASKVPLNTTILACVWNPETGNKNCGWDNTQTQFGPLTIILGLPQKGGDNK